jgi:prevent-host-death family protein
MPWSLQDAKNRFSQVVDAAVGGEPQVVTRHGKPAVVVIAAPEYERLASIDRGTAPSLAEWLLSIPQDDGVFERATLEPRDVDPACS